MRFNLGPFENEYTKQSHGIGTDISQIIECGAKMGLQFEKTGDVSVQHIAYQTNAKQDYKPALATG
jgi:hypothetical protein